MSGKTETVWDCAQFREELDLTLKKLRDPENYRTMCFDFWKDGKVQVHGVWVTPDAEAPTILIWGNNGYCHPRYVPCWKKAVIAAYIREFEPNAAAVSLCYD